MSFQYKPLPKNPCAWGWQSGANRIYQALGIKGTKIPESMHGVFKVDGWTVIVKRAGKDARGGKPRVFVDYGGREVPAGRVYQALCRTTVHRARKRAARSRGEKGRFEYKRRGAMGRRHRSK
jgi:hypothetical protein